MAKALSLAPEKFILECDRELPEEEQTIFMVRPLKMRERAELQDGILVSEFKQDGPKTGGGTGVFRHLSGTQARIALEKGLIEIQNLQGPDGDTLKYSRDTKADRKEEILDSLHPEWVNEITKKILELSGLSKEEEKN